MRTPGGAQVATASAERAAGAVLRVLGLRDGRIAVGTGSQRRRIAIILYKAPLEFTTSATWSLAPGDSTASYTLPVPTWTTGTGNAGTLAASTGSANTLTGGEAYATDSVTARLGTGEASVSVTCQALGPFADAGVGMVSARGGHALVRASTKLLVLGGNNSANSLLPSVEAATIDSSSNAGSFATQTATTGSYGGVTNTVLRAWVK